MREFAWSAKYESHDRVVAADYLAYKGLLRREWVRRGHPWGEAMYAAWVSRLYPNPISYRAPDRGGTLRPSRWSWHRRVTPAFDHPAYAFLRRWPPIFNGYFRYARTAYGAYVRAYEALPERIKLALVSGEIGHETD